MTPREPYYHSHSKTPVAGRGQPSTVRFPTQQHFYERARPDKLPHATCRLAARVSVVSVNDTNVLSVRALEDMSGVMQPMARAS